MRHPVEADGVRAWSRRRCGAERWAAYKGTHHVAHELECLRAELDHQDEREQVRDVDETALKDDAYDRHE